MTDNTINYTVKLIHQGKLELTKVVVKLSKNETIFKPKSEEDNNYYRSDRILGNIGNKDRNINTVDSEVKVLTQSTEEVEDVYAEISDSDASTKDLQGFDIAAKSFGCSGFKQMKDSEAYKAFLDANSDDFSLNQVKDSEVALFDKTKSDGKVRLFTSEIVDGKEVLAIRDKENNIHYFDKETRNEIK